MSGCFGPSVSEAHLVVHIAVDLFYSCVLSYHTNEQISLMEICVQFSIVTKTAGTILTIFWCPIVCVSLDYIAGTGTVGS